MFLTPFGWLYGKIADLRNSLYEKGSLESFSLGAPAVSIGNITVGGTGKTPMVVFAVEVLAENGEKVCVLTRGYGRKSPKDRVLVSDGEQILSGQAEAGDEPFETAGKLLGKAVVVADADRVAAARWAHETFGVSAFVLDDAFQHRRARRDLDIVLLDATDPFGNGKVLPAGRLREPAGGLRRADAIVITRANLVSRERVSRLKAEIAEYGVRVPVFISENKVSRVLSLDEFRRCWRVGRSESGDQPGMSIDAARTTAAGDGQHVLKVRRALAFCALGNPENFLAQLKHEGYRVEAAETFADHYRYRQSDARRIEDAARRAGAEILLTTAKDAVKLADLYFELPCFVVESKMTFDREEELRDLITGAAKKGGE